MTEAVFRDDLSCRPVPGMGVEAFFPIPDTETFAATASEWLAKLPGLLAPAEWEEVLQARRPPFRGKLDLRWPEYDEWAEPFMVWGTITVAPLKWNGMRIWHRRATKRNLEWLAKVLADRPVTARIQVGRVDAEGIMLPGGVEVAAESGLGQPGELIPAGKLAARDSLMWRPGARLEDAARLRDGLAGRRAWAGRPGTSGLLAGEDLANKWELPFSGSPEVHWDRAMLERDLPRYSWLTLCPAGPAAKLGGALALQASGAFWRVDELPGGALLLQATEQADAYDIAVADRVYGALTPALPPA